MNHWFYTHLCKFPRCESHAEMSRIYAWLVTRILKSLSFERKLAIFTIVIKKYPFRHHESYTWTQVFLLSATPWWQASTLPRLSSDFGHPVLYNSSSIISIIDSSHAPDILDQDLLNRNTQEQNARSTSLTSGNLPPLDNQAISPPEFNQRFYL